MLLMDDSPIGGKRINANTFFLNKDIDEATTLNPFSHIYMFDVGFTPELHCSIALKFNQSIYASYLISYKAPRDIIGTFGFHVEFMNHQFKTNMHGKYNIIPFFYCALNLL